MPYVCRRLEYRGSNLPAAAGDLLQATPEEFRAHQDLHARSTALSFLLCSGVATAPKTAAARLKGTDTGQACRIQMSDPVPTTSTSACPVTTPTRSRWKIHRPDARQVPQRGRIVHSTRSPYEVNITSATYRSYRRVVRGPWCSGLPGAPAARLTTTYKAFDWDGPIAEANHLCYAVAG